VLELTILLIVGLVLALLFLLLVANLGGRVPETPPAPAEELLGLVPLPGISCPHLDRLFDSTDYEFLSRQQLPEVARQLDRDRRQAALLWLGLLRQDFLKLRQFHRTLLACGARTSPRAEWALLVNSFSFRLSCPLLALWIRVFGLYAAPRVHTALLASLRHVSTVLAATLGRLSPDQLAQLKEAWAAQHPRPTAAG